MEHETATAELKHAALQDVDSSSIKEQLQGVEGRSHKTYEAEYGVNADTHEFVMHFFPPGYAAGNDVTPEWPNRDRFRDKLKVTLDKYFEDLISQGQVQAGYVDELRSFFVQLRGKPAVPDFAAFLDSFFRHLEAA